MDNTIPKVMLRDHARIHNLLQKLKSSLNSDQEEAEHLFIRLKWSIEKHFFIEEKVIFSIYRISQQSESEELDKLVTEHKDFLYLINKIEDDLKNSDKDLEQLDRELTAHAHFEDKIFYPRLEDELSEQEKELIKDRAKNLVE